ncbi:MAG: homoserine kinase [Nevskiales bacterium]
MSVYTKVSREELAQFLRGFPVGELVDHHGIKAGITNTNYFVNTRDGHWVLTLFEHAAEADLPYFLGLMDHLALRGIACPRPVADHSGNFLTRLKNRPAALVQKLEGHTVAQPNKKQCAAVGKLLGDLHLAGQSFAHHRAPDRGADWRVAATEKVLPRLDAASAALLRDEVAYHEAHRAEYDALPQGVIHADLFRDNALFSGQQLAGVIDFYYACNDALLYDLAVTANDWCAGDKGALDADRYHATVHAYAGERAVSEAERQAWPGLLRAAALRFWLSRLYDSHFPRGGELTQTKNPDEFRAILEFHRSGNGLSLP